MITRRTFIKHAAQAGIAAVAITRTGSLIAKNSAAPLLPLDGQPLVIPPVISGGDLTLAAGTSKIYTGIDTHLLLINNSFPAPTIKVRKGDTFTATIKNNLTEDSLLHWHGVHAPSEMSGHPQYAIAPGGSYNVTFPIIQRASTNFYHAHPHMKTGEQVYRGLAGLFIIEDDEEQALGLPSGEYDVPLMITDKRFDAQVQLIYAPNNLDINSGWLGDTILVNGTPNAFLAVARTLYRFRVVNASNSRFYKLALSDGKSFTIIGNDGGLIDTPLNLSSAWLAPAERLDILIDFSSYTQGQNINLQSEFFSFSDGPGSGSLEQGAAMNLMQFQITKTGSSGGVIPSQLPPIVKYQEVDSTNTRIWTFAAIHHVNDLGYDLHRIDANVPFDKLEKWTFISEAQNTHPIHVHGAQFQIIDRNGKLPEAYESGWKDVVRIDPVGTVNVLVKFDAYQGLFLIHCHKLEHADMGMMANFVVGTEGIEEPASAEDIIRISPNPASSYALLSFASLRTDQELMIIDEKGSVIIKEILSAGTDQFEIDASPLSTGSYKILLGKDHANFVVIK